jgi:GntR family transcriptional regulator
MSDLPPSAQQASAGLDAVRPLAPGPVPLHHQLYVDLRERLDAGALRPGDRLPPERRLALAYGCSLITVRRALDELARERRIERLRGRGTFVTAPPIERDLAALTSFTQEMHERGLDPHSRVVEARGATADRRVAHALDLAAAAPTLYLERVRSVGGRPLLLEQVHLPAERFAGLLAEDLEHGSLYDILARRYGVHLLRAREAIEPVLPSPREAELLEQDVRHPALLLELIAFGTGDVPVEYCRSLVRGDRARYFVDAGPRLAFVQEEPPRNWRDPR